MNKAYVDVFVQCVSSTDLTEPQASRFGGWPIVSALTFFKSGYKLYAASVARCKTVKRQGRKLAEK